MNKKLSILNLFLILLVFISVRQVLACGQTDTRNLAFVPGEEGGVLNLEIRDEKGKLLEIIEDDSGFFGAFYMVHFLGGQTSPNSNRQIDSQKYEKQFFFLQERASKMYRDFNSVPPDSKGRKEILEKVANLKNVATVRPSPTSQENIYTAWTDFVDSLTRNEASITARKKKSADEPWGEIEDVNLASYYRIYKKRGSCNTNYVIDLDGRYGKEGESGSGGGGKSK